LIFIFVSVPFFFKFSYIHSKISVFFFKIPRWKKKQKKIYPYRYKFWNTPLIMFRPNINYDAYISQWFIVCTFCLFFFFKFLSRGIPSPFVYELFYFLFLCVRSRDPAHQAASTTSFLLWCNLFLFFSPFFVCGFLVDITRECK
jgi:hypothetical protein